MKKINIDCLLLKTAGVLLLAAAMSVILLASKYEKDEQGFVYFLPYWLIATMLCIVGIALVNAKKDVDIKKSTMKFLMKRLGKKREWQKDSKTIATVKDLMSKVEGEITVKEYYTPGGLPMMTVFPVFPMPITLLSEQINKETYEKLRNIFDKIGGFENIPFYIIKREFKDRILFTMQAAGTNLLFGSSKIYFIEIYGKEPRSDK